MSKTTRYIAVLPVIMLLVPVASAQASPYVFFDYGGLKFTYTLTDGSPTVGGQIGTLVVTDTGGSSPFLAAQKWGLGANGIMDGPGVGDDALLGSTNVFGASSLNVLLDAVVIYLGPNNYRIETTATGLTGSDWLTGTTSGNQYEAEFNSTQIVLDVPDNEFTFRGGLSVLGANDSILRNNESPASESWLFEGAFGDDASIGLSGVGGERRTQYTRGELVEVHILFTPGIDTLDEFFGFGGSGPYTQTSSATDLEITIVPAPGALVIGAVGLALVAWRRRRIL